MGRRRSRLRRLAVLLVLVGAGVYWWRRSTRLPEPEVSAPEWPPLEPAAAETSAPAAAPSAAVPRSGPTDAVQETENWRSPEGSSCPEGFPVKATRSGVFHVPGGMFYDRATPHRCYRTPAAAEADGYRASKR